MKKTITYFILFVLCSSFARVYAQDGFNRHYLELGFGNSINLTPGSGSGSNELIPQANTNAFTFSYRYSFFPFKHWGVYSDMYFSFPKWSMKSSAADGGNYYYIVNSYYDNNETDGLGGMSIGVTARWENERFCVRPYVGFGFHDMKYGDYNYYVKEKGSNQIQRVTYELNNSFDAYEVSTVINTGVVVSYKLFKKIHAHLDISYMRHLKENRSVCYTSDAYDGYSFYDGEIRTTTSKPERNLNIKLGVTWAVGFTNRK